MEIEGLKLDINNEEFLDADDFVYSTNHNIFLTGKAGTGKTTFLKYIKKSINKNTVVLAPTGVAAINAGGNTIHSFFQIKPSVYIPNDHRLRTRVDKSSEDRSTIYDYFQLSSQKRKIIENFELLIIDEISMVRADMLDVIDRLLRVFAKKKSYLPFGGIQVILIGDTFQLPPIAKNEEWEILRKFYKSPFFFSAKVIEKLISEQQLQYLELKKIYRQNDKSFIELLNRIRVNSVTTEDMQILNHKYDPKFGPDNNSNYITLATHNRIVDEINHKKLLELTSESYFFQAKVEDIFPENIYPTNFELELKEKAQVMFIKNDIGGNKRYFNGKIGEIKELSEESILISSPNEDDIQLSKYTWENIRYKWNNETKKVEEEVIGSFTQFPLKLAWAITVHKSQGLTFEKVIADLNAAWDSGQVYVALSRCTSMDGLVLKTPITRKCIKTNPEVLEFAQNETPSTLINKLLEEGKADYLYQCSRKSFQNREYSESLEYFIKALSYRNDIGTHSFKRFFSVYTSKYLFRDRIIDFIRKRQEVLISQINEQYDNVESKDDIIRKKTDAIKYLQEELDKKARKIDWFNNLKWYQKIFYKF